MYRIPLKRFFQFSFGSKVKVTLIFLVSLSVPSAFLLFLAIRGIENDRALAEQNLLSEHKIIANSLAMEVDEEISLVEEKLINLLRESSELSEADWIRSIIARLSSSALIDEIFVLKEGTLVYPIARLLYQIDPSQPSDQVQSSRMDVRRIIDEAEMNEFQLKNYTRAGELYRSALKITPNHHTRADLLMRIARVSTRKGALAQAMETYTVVVDRYSKSRLPGGLPGGLAARLELTGLSLRNKDFTKAGRMLCELYQELLERNWSLNRHQFRFLQTRIESLATELEDSLESSDTDAYCRIEEFNHKADSLASRTDYLLEVQSAGLPIVLDLMREETGNGNYTRRLVITGSDAQFLLLIARAAEHHGNRFPIVGAIINQTELAGSILPGLIENLAVGDNSTLIIRDADGGGIYGLPPPAESRMTVVLPFTGNFPPWSIELHQDDPQFFEQLLSSRRSFYIYALVIVMLALTFGAIMTLRMMARELELARLKSDFVSTVSHEFKSPLTSIRQLSEMLQSGRVLSETRRKHYYDVILEQSERLSRLVSNILDLASIDDKRLRLDFSLVDMKELLTEIVVRARQQGGGEEIPIKLDVDDHLPLAFVDPGAITQIMNNLIDNAIKYSGESPNVSITVRIDNDEMVIRVEDEGIGIPQEEIEKVFERFYRVGDEFTRKVKGSGLGLALVKELVLAHKGTVRVSSEIGKGSLFTVRLPLARDEEKKHG
jgi:signal transduction histidine kinase/tetratricopeptide (TPR) repeat protein